jgi:hypothetical protein
MGDRVSGQTFFKNRNAMGAARPSLAKLLSPAAYHFRETISSPMMVLKSRRAHSRK